MAIKTWTGAGLNELWNTGANWSGGTIPVAGDDIIFNGAGVTGKKNCTLNVITSFASINFTGYTNTGIAPYNGTFTFSSSLNMTGAVTLDAGSTYLTSGTVTTYSLSVSGTSSLISNGKILPVNLVTGFGTFTINGNADFSGNLTASLSAHNIKAATGTTVDLRIGGNINMGAATTNATDYVTVKGYGTGKTFFCNGAGANARVNFVSGSTYTNTGTIGISGTSFFTVEPGGQFNALNNTNNFSVSGTTTLSGFNSSNNSDFISISGSGTYILLNDTVIKGFINITTAACTISTSVGAKILLEGNFISAGTAITTIDYLEFSGTTLSTVSATSTTNLQIKNISFNKTGAGSVNITATSFTLTVAASATYTWTHTAGTITQSTNSRISIACLGTTSQLIYSESIALSTPFTFSTLSFNGGILSLNSTLRATRLYLTLALNNTTNITSSGTLGFDVDILSIINSSAAVRFLTLKAGCTYNINVQLYMTSLSGSAGQITLASNIASSYTYFNLDNNAAQFVEYVTATDIDSSGTLGVPTFTKQLIYNLQGILTPGRTINWALGAQPPPVLPSRTVAYTFVN
jgi:hypothetical protein